MHFMLSANEADGGSQWGVKGDHTIITIPESPMFNAPEAAPVTVPRLELVKKAGKQYAEDFRVSEKLLEEIGTPMIPEEQYARIVNQ